MVVGKRGFSSTRSRLLDLAHSVKTNQIATVASVLWLAAVSQSYCFGQTINQKEFLGTVLPPESICYASIKVPSPENTYIRSDSTGGPIGPALS